MESVLTRSQKRTIEAPYRAGVIRAEFRHDDECGNGHNTTAVTGCIYSPERIPGEESIMRHGKRLWPSIMGCIHDEIREAFQDTHPEVVTLVEWHGCSTDGPLHYISNTIYLAGDRDVERIPTAFSVGKARELDAARRAACWPDATDEELTAPGLKERLEARLPELLRRHRAAVEAAGLVW